ncbi:uncharacterized protein LOC117812052 isoform X1 [Xyrichtys novacula]|uniref:Uncharacterized protein LOC117812052 isoform X1 n=1 Tax=Xyrichtys novacula TaxID=13765 RepID=A0AAV1G0R4_XYRNO|nr:uncharacterized protein LOC117812052 isoform X1 [Xyrichtys novacula]
MSGMEMLRVLVNERLAAAAEEIFGLVGKTISEYQDEVMRSKREICELKQQIEQLTELKPGGKSFKTETEKLCPSLQLCDIKVEQIKVQQIPVLVQTETEDQPLVKEEQEDQCIRSDTEVDTYCCAGPRVPKSEPTIPCEPFTSSSADTVSVNESRNDRRSKRSGSSPQVHEDWDTVRKGVSNELTAPLSSVDPLYTCLHHPRPSSRKTQNSWISKLQIPWGHLPASLLHAIGRGTRAFPTDKRAMVRAVVSAMQEHCPKPDKGACIEVAKMIVTQYPVTFADPTAEGGQFGKSVLSFARKLKTRIDVSSRRKRKKT